MTAAWTRLMAFNMEKVDGLRYILEVETVFEVNIKEEGKGKEGSSLIPQCLA